MIKMIEGYRNVSKKATDQDVWGWLMGEFRKNHLSQYKVLIDRQKARIDWRDSGGRYSAIDNSNMKKAFRSIYGSAMNANPFDEYADDLLRLFNEVKQSQDVILFDDQPIVDGLEGIKSQQAEKLQFNQKIATDLFIALAEMDDDEFDTFIDILSERKNWSRIVHLGNITAKGIGKGRNATGMAAKEVGKGLNVTGSAAKGVEKGLYKGLGVAVKGVERGLHKSLGVTGMAAKRIFESRKLVKINLPDSEEFSRKSRNARNRVFGDDANNLKDEQ